MKPVRIIIAGAGGRGSGYAAYARQHPDLMQVVGVAEPREFYRTRMADAYGIPPENVFTDWREMISRDKFSDAVIIATQDADHAEPAVAFAARKYNILLEKPMAPNETDCRRIVDAAVRNRIVFAVCHVLRYTQYTRKLKAMIDSGAIGEVVSIQHLEPVGFWHQAHSYVRGNWRNEKESSSMLLAKSCHDLDWLRHIMGAKCTAISSFGSLKHFRKEEQPEGAAGRCLDCSVEAGCPYSAKKIYLDKFDAGYRSWPVDVIAPGMTRDAVIEALRRGPYGRCVYACDNDVVDNQVVAMQFAGGKTAGFTMTAFTDFTGRKTRIFGTRGQLTGDDSTIIHYDFLADKYETTGVGDLDTSILGGHGGGDYGLMQHFVRALATNDPSHILSGPQETLETHLMVFAAERARRENRVITLD
jgi:predicted dehydrogenase